MANAYKCDRCGKFFAHGDILSGKESTIGNYRFKFILSSEETLRQVFLDPFNRRLDLCPDCLKELEVWFDNPSRVYSIPPVKKKWWEVIFRKGKKNG